MGRLDDDGVGGGTAEDGGGEKIRASSERMNKVE